MPFKYNPPTRTVCDVCEQLAAHEISPIIDKLNGKASNSNNYPVHNWYNFVLGYTPEFPKYIIKKLSISESDFVVDPFLGSGTTMVVCKESGISSSGVEANDFFADVSKTKLGWNINLDTFGKNIEAHLTEVSDYFLDHFIPSSPDTLNFNSIKSCELIYFKRPALLLEKYVSELPFQKLMAIQHFIRNSKYNDSIKKLLVLALSSIIVPCSNVRYGPGFGIIKPKHDIDVLSLYRNKLNRMYSDLAIVTSKKYSEYSDVINGDSRRLSEYYKDASVNHMITSPPYPGDHEYTKHTRLELILMGYVNDLSDFKAIKKKMIRGSTTNIYKEDNDRVIVKDFISISNIVAEIEKRLKHDGATSGFEKLYTKLIWEYFGGMHKVLSESLKILKEGGTFSLLVSDSHAFKMVHIQTAKILQEIAFSIGYKKAEILLWQHKISTSHKYNLREDILILTK